MLGHARCWTWLAVACSVSGLVARGAEPRGEPDSPRDLETVRVELIESIPNRTWSLGALQAAWSSPTPVEHAQTPDQRLSGRGHGAAFQHGWPDEAPPEPRRSGSEKPQAPRPSPTLTLVYDRPQLAITTLPKRYTERGVIASRSNPLLIRATGQRGLPAGTYRLLLRSRSAARLWVDGQLVAENPFMNTNASGHESVPELTSALPPDVRPPGPGDQDAIIQLTLEAGPHLFSVEAIVGGQEMRPEVGELCLAIAAPGDSFRLLAPASRDMPTLTDDSWERLARAERDWLGRFDRASRSAPQESEYWAQRHASAAAQMASRPPVVVPDLPAGAPGENEIDRFIAARLAAEGVEPAPLTDDYQFLRRLTFDVIGVMPTSEEIAALLADSRADRRARVIQRLLDDPRWADSWVGYWQDVLAENPGILKPQLNNTGPFRWWIHESLMDNKPLDRFVTELIAMDGSRYEGGPAGFAIATQNDAPLAAKAHVVAQAFLGLQMTCARCHDAPHHPYTQSQLFSLAAMLRRESIELPASSTVPASPDGHVPLVTSSLKPGDRIEPAWPLEHLIPADVPAGWLRDGEDARERLAAIITSPRSDRFAQVVVNRVWKRYMGWGIVEPVDDWHDARPSHPELLAWLARQFVAHGYDLKHVARLILESHAYQRQAAGSATRVPEPGQRLFAAPARRRLSAEQVVDSLFAVAGKSLGAEPLTLDPEGRRPFDTFLNLGVPARGWEFTSLSNERDRPALALPVAQSIVDLLTTFGWRDSRPNPLTEREDAANVLQPLLMANGIASNRVAQLSDDNRLTELCLQELTADELVESLFLAILSRRPTSEEREPLAELLREGFEQRRVAVVERRVSRRRDAVSWSNHLSPEATRIKLEQERTAREGDPPTGRLTTNWRERAEDVIWALVNSPEFVFLP